MDANNSPIFKYKLNNYSLLKESLYSDRSIINRPQNILIMLPHSPRTLLINQTMKLQILQLLRFIINELVYSLSMFFYQKKFSVFDPHIGDTLCQIRAYKVLLLSYKSTFNINEQLKKIKRSYSLVNQCIANFEFLIKHKKDKYQRELDSSEELFNFIQQYGLNLDIPEYLIFIAQAKIVANFSKVDAEGISRGIDYPKFCQKAGVSKSLAKRIIHYYQQRIAAQSCSFIIELLQDLPESTAWKSKLIKLQQVDRDKRQVLPCYEVTKVLLRHILKEKQPIILSVERKVETAIDVINLLFVSNQDGTHFVLSNNALAYPADTPCIVVQGIIKYSDKEAIETKEQFINRLTSVGLMNIILANMAKHPQYAVSELQHLSDNPYRSLLDMDIIMNELEAEFIKMKKLSIKVGCCLENASLFLVRHIFCSLMDNKIN